MVIEIIGLPGVGKTYLFNHIRLYYQDLSPLFIDEEKSTYSAFWYDCWFYFCHPFLVLGARKEKYRNEILVRFKRIARRRKHLQKNGILVDCGTFQPIVETFLLWQRNSKLICWEKIFSQQVKDHFYLIFNDEIGNIVNREFTRNKRLFTFDKKYLENKYTECMKILDTVKPAMNFVEVRISKYDKIEELAYEVYRDIKRVHLL